MRLSFSCSWRTEKTAAEYPRCIRPAGTSAEASTTPRGSAVPCARAPPRVLKGVVLRGTESLLTHRWRAMDSNYQFRVPNAISEVRKSDICDRKCAVGLRRPSLDSPKLGRAS
jgi:hypothetical protein